MTSLRHRMRRYGSAPPSAGRHRWIAVALVLVVLVAMAVWIGVQLSDWPPPPPNSAAAR